MDGASVEAGVDAGAVRASRRGQPLRAYELIDGYDRAPSRADDLIAEGWSPDDAAKPGDRVQLAGPIAWEERFANDRSKAIVLHSWAPLGIVLAAYSANGRPELLAFAVAVAVDWARTHPGPEVPSEFAWYDMAVGKRAYRLGYMIDAAARLDDVTDEDLATLLASARAHGQALAGEDGFSPRHNHGFYWAAGQLALARRLPELPDAEAGRRQAEERLAQLVATQFTAEGVHREHSPQYHRMMMNSVCGLADAGLLGSVDADSLVGRMEHAMAAFIMPSGHLAPVGDSPRARLPAYSGLAASDPALRFVLTQGRHGAPPGSLVAFPASGYAAVRHPAPGGGVADSSYLLQVAAAHSLAHKHADDQSFIWCDRGTDLLVDAGRYGYARADPNRRYIESSSAHNVVEVDGRRQAKDQAHRGSALGRTGISKDVYFIETVRAEPPIERVRMLVLRPRSWLLVLDWLCDAEGRPHRFDQRFQLAPEVGVRSTPDGLYTDVAAIDDPLFAVSLVDGVGWDVARGRDAPDLLGWLSGQDGVMTATATATFTVDDVAQAWFATLFWFGRAAPRPDPATQLDPAGGRGTLAWHADGARHAVDFDRRGEGALTLAYDAVW